MFDFLKIAHYYAEEPGTYLLMSGSKFDSARKSYLFLFPNKYVRGKEGFIRLSGREGVSCNNPWEGLKEEVGDLRGGGPLPEWVGYFAYEMGAFSDRRVAIPHKNSVIFDFCFMRHSVVIEYDHATGKIKNLRGSLGVKCRDLPDIRFRDETPAKLICRDTEEDYVRKVKYIKKLIVDGDLYQANLSQRLVFKTHKRPFEIFVKLFLKNPAPFAAYINMGDFAIMSSSPERLLRKRGDVLETRPIKGTAPRGAALGEDVRNRMRLLHSEKDRAELLMITDLMRNDLAKVSVPGSVETKKIVSLEEYANVFHLLSVIRSRVAENHPLDILKAVFPGGSVTGCPKMRAMEVIGRLERFPRGIYTGSIGYLAENGDFDFNIAIRTLLWRDRIVDCRLGGAVVADSNPKSEFVETLHKGRSIFETLSCGDLAGSPGK